MLELLSFINPSEVDTSSANFHISVPFDIELRSFIITKNKIGPSLVPCDTPKELGGNFIQKGAISFKKA